MIRFPLRVLMFGWRNAMCLTFPWHRWRYVRQLSRIADKYRCVHCQRSWVFNHDMKVALPWETARELYDARDIARYGRVIVD